MSNNQKTEQSESTEQRERLASLTGAKEIPKSSTLVNRIQLTGTPFFAIVENEKICLTMKNYKLSPTFDNMGELEEWMNENQYMLCFHIAAIVHEQIAEEAIAMRLDQHGQETQLENLIEHHESMNKKDWHKD